MCHTESSKVTVNNSSHKKIYIDSIIYNIIIIIIIIIFLWFLVYTVTKKLAWVF